jgi:dihydrodipicolinate synthase/N-acetylneuraminate lyase
MANKSVLSGIIAPVVTPFTKEETLDEKIFRREVKYLLNTGIHGISPGGSTGEGELISDAELVRMVEIIEEENSGKLPVVAGVNPELDPGSNSDSTGCQKSRGHGVDGPAHSLCGCYRC